MSTRPTNAHEDTAALSAVRALLLIIFLLGTLGTGTELLLLGHTEIPWQIVPVLLIAASLVALIFRAAVRRAPSNNAGIKTRVASIWVFQVLMMLFIGSGFIGVWQHYQAKMEFKLEVNPGLSGMELFRETITGAAIPPVLAPGMMIQMGLVGLALTYRQRAKINVTVQRGE
jgi:ABC-type polysaccharide/polyol phosphate export permease